MKFVKNLSRAAALAAVCIMLFGSMSALTLAGDEPYDTYNYNFREDAIYTPSAYSPTKSITGVELTFNGEPLGKFANPQDICRSMDDGNFYVADTGNNRIVVFNSDMTEVINIISSFDNNGTNDTFSAPYGVCVSEKGQIYVADSQNRRIVVLEKNGELVRIVDNPVSQSLEEGYVFTPLKVTVDYADRIYCIAQNMFEGIMVFESDGNFTGFFGTISVKLSAWDKFWKRIATKEERKKQKLYIPTEFTGIDVDTDGFIYATNVDAEGVQAVRRLNPRGEDVIKKGENKNVGGDLMIGGTSTYAGASQMTDVVYRGDGMYSMLDRKRGRVFTYDHEGNLLYIFGGLGTQTGTFKVPVAIEAMGTKIVVLDASNESITIFEETEYGRLINEAIALRYDGDETQAVEKWREVLKLDENNELANTGIGKAYLTAGENKLAMKYLKLGMNSEYYSIAFRRYRNELLEKNLSLILSVAAVLIVGLVVFFRLRKRKKNKKAEEGGMNVG
ncbi:MAG: SMP-30/gluconolactonase/LRE family protein [Butyrivibrio sp.]|nr:SMP-30/gluconolactonase/LRE family protein [Butyrivibrio sp.]